jgi:hypothetical protein
VAVRAAPRQPARPRSNPPPATSAAARKPPVAVPKKEKDYGF